MFYAANDTTYIKELHQRTGEGGKESLCEGRESLVIMLLVSTKEISLCGIER